ncbi:MAG: TonB-dependent receptor [Proteobacteria bacterium]|nr:TonB-dependent receptor [Pseudomonadota bacterium]
MRKSCIISIFFFLILNSYLPSSQLLAADFSSDAEEDLLFANIDSVYTASKHEQKITEAPARVSIVTAEEIHRYGYRTLADILGSLPGFYVSYDRNYSYIGVRGFGLPGDYNTRLLLLVDGHRVNDNIFDSMYSDRAFIVDVALIERVEVVRGPSSSLYGSNAFFGVVNVITKKGRDLNGAEVSGAAGSRESHQGRLSYGKRLQNGLEFLVSGTFYESDGDDNLYYKEFDTPETNSGVAEDADDDKATNLFAKIAFADFTLNALYVEREKGIPTAPWGSEFNTSDTRSWDDRWYLDLNYQHLYDSGIEVNGRLFYDRYIYEGDYIFDYGPPPDIVTNKDSDIGEWWGAEVHLSRNFLKTHHFTIGGEFRDSLKQEQQNYDRYGLWLDSNPDINSWGLFIQDNWNILANLIFNMGLRHDDYDSSGSSTNPRAALIYSPFKKSTFKLLYGRAFRAPNAYELFYHDGYSTAKPNPELDAETIESFEFIWEQRVTENIRGSASVYRNEIDDLISYNQDPSDGLYFFDNLGNAQATGAEVSMEGKWQNGWLTALSYTYQHAKDKDTGARLVNSPRHMIKTNLLVPLFDEMLQGGLEVKYESGRKTVDDRNTARNYITNVSLASSNIVPGMTLSATVFNLFDDGYDYPGSEEHTQNMIKQDGRTFWFEATYLY